MQLSKTIDNFFKIQGLKNYLISQKSAAIFSFLLFAVTTTLGIVEQYKTGILFYFSFSNLVIFTLSVLYLIILSQYFLLNDNAFFYYVLYLFLNIFYFHNVVFFGDQRIFLKFGYIHNQILLSSLLFTYFLYSQFALHFLNLKNSNADLQRKIKLCSKIYLSLFFTDLILSTFENFFWNKNIFYIFFQFACIIVGFYAILNIIIFKKTRLARIFIAGTICYYTGSVFGFLFNGQIFTNPFTNIAMKNWTFFTETGTLLEVIFFSTGLAYRMRLIEVEKMLLNKSC